MTEQTTEQMVRNLEHGIEAYKDENYAADARHRMKAIQSEADAAEEKFKADQQRDLYRTDGTPLYSEAEMSERLEAVRK